MTYLRILVLLVSTLVVVFGDEVQLAPREPRDRFRLMAGNVDEQRVKDEIHDLTSYGCEKMVVIRNRAQDEFTLSCKSHHDAPKKPTVIKPGNAFVFTFRPRRDGKTNFWCTVEYKYQFARFDVYNEALAYMCPRSIDEVYQYTVTHDGVHVDEAKGNEGTKIRALFKGHNKFILWETFSNNKTDGLLYSGLVDGGMCSDVPEQFNDKPQAVTICYNHCVQLYEHYGCRGKMQVVQASDDCVDVEINSDVSGKLSAVKGC